MTQEQILEGNKLIAEFMGGKVAIFNVSNQLYFKNLLHGRTILFADLKYHTSWDWLMPVVEKIKSFYKNDEEYQYFNRVLSARIWETIDNIWPAVVEFINWYNQNK